MSSSPFHLKSLAASAAVPCALIAWLGVTALPAAPFTPLIPLPAPKATTKGAVTGGGFAIAHFFDRNLRTEYASQDEGTNTVVDLEFATPSLITAVRHIDRNDPATVAESEIDFFDNGGHKIDTIRIIHANKRSGETLFLLPAPVTAHRAKWRVTRQGNKGLFSLGGAELSFFTSAPNEALPARDVPQVRVLPFRDRQGNQPVEVTIEHRYVEPAEVTVRLGQNLAEKVTLKSGFNRFDWQLPHVQSEKQLKCEIDFESKTAVRSNFVHRPVRPMTIYILPHSHTDIGYTEIQTAIEDKQVKNLRDGMAAARRTANYPEGARFVWNVEVGWAADLYLSRMDATQKAEFYNAVKNGQVVLNGMYLNELTGLCRPEELVQLFSFATKMARQTGVAVDSAMISDVPGFTWGSVSAMSQAGIKYFSAAPNYFDRIGTILKEWENKPFYWLGPDGKTKVLVWIPFWGYAMSHIYHEMSPKLVADFFEGLDKRNYSFDVAYVRWSGHGDNAVPDPAICDFVKDWNAKYEWPKFIISATGDAFRALEKRYGDKLPIVRGDWTPYWEDGAGSSALETGQNRHSSDRLSQAATLFALRNPAGYPGQEFEDAWRNVLLYSEHTWGAWCSVSGPERKETHEQWAIKKSYADKAAAQSRELLDKAMMVRGRAVPAPKDFEVINTLSWERSEPVVLPSALSKAADGVTDSKGNAVASQRLKSGELLFLAHNVPPYAAKRFSLDSFAIDKLPAAASVQNTILENGIIRVRVDQTTGAIVELSGRGVAGNLADTSGGEALNDYRYLLGDDIRDLQRNGQVKIQPGEQGPLVASLIIESPAPGCRNLRRELRVFAGQDYVEIINTVDKARLTATNYFAKNGKESLNFAFPFKIPNGSMLVDLPIGAMRPELDQIPSACKNWVTVGRWVDISNRDQGVTWVTLDAPLIDIGEISATMLNSQTNPEVWRKRIEKTQRFYSWAMNNHWGTNYRAYQDGPTVFRFILRPHPGRTDSAEATRFATGFSHPLLPTTANTMPTQPMLTLSSPEVVITGLKPADDGKAWILRLYGASGKSEKVKLNWGERKPAAVYLSDTGERVGEEIGKSTLVPGYGLVTLRAEFD